MEKKKQNRLILFVFLAILDLGLLALFDWKHFLPLKDHSDLRFQIVGEAAAYVVSLLVAFIWPFGLSRDVQSKYLRLSVWARFFITGLLSTSLTATFDWRSFFDG